MNKRGFGQRLQAARLEKGLTAEQLSEIIGLSYKSINQLEGGSRGTTLPRLVKICNTLQVSADYLFGEDLTHSSCTPNEDLLKLISELSVQERHMLTELVRTYAMNKEK